MNIIIIHDDGTSNLATDFNSDYGRSALTIMYRNKNHYESVVEINEELIASYAKDIMHMEKKRYIFVNNLQEDEIILVV